MYWAGQTRLHGNAAASCTCTWTERVQAPDSRKILILPDVGDAVAKKTRFDPDSLVLTKPEIVGFCDRVLKKWSKNPTKYANGIVAMNAVRTSVLWTDDASLKMIWSEILAWTFELLYENAMAQDVPWADTMKKIRAAK